MFRALNSGERNVARDTTEDKQVGFGKRSDQILDEQSAMLSAMRSGGFRNDDSD